ncbi:FAD-dependent oxidoreductase [Actinokineospora sp. PR83]|uniref:FAD-dependent oxidoreductase n=1 Tax=Actinokineospora sp. PR83 TaxID=2884908 RepID=UPI001F454FAE|nr:FAD-dependent oxidoreductase [Actinokineospora sp. PR83]MCG8918341.1 FAD-dependent oxidoreductase [Actinokineospora sp. PR83]
MVQRNRVTPDDPRYAELAGRGDNTRFTPAPDEFVAAADTAEVVAAVQDAVDRGVGVTARSGGHCYEDFVSDPRQRVVVDLAALDTVEWDAGRGAVAVGPGVRLLDLYAELHRRWGTTLPGGASATVAVGGHLAGGGYGPLSRALGTAVDHVHAVEVVTVDAGGRAAAVVATRDPADPAHELWWALTGIGGGNLGIITRYWLRSPGADGSAPETALPAPPGTVLSTSRLFPREGMTREAFRALVGAHGRWHERNSAPGSPYAGLFGGLVLFAKQPQDDPGLSAILFLTLDGDGPGAAELLAGALADMTGGVDAPSIDTPVTAEPWPAAVRTLAGAQDGAPGRHKIKSAYLRAAYTDEQADTLYDRLADDDHPHRGASVSLQSTGCAVNAVAPDATAVAQRDSVLRALYLATWDAEADDAAALAWVRGLYHAVYAGTGGVPAPGARDDGCHINFPDPDLADPRWNTSGVPWQHLYFKDNLPRLHAAAKTWDPLGVFGHALSVR